MGTHPIFESDFDCLTGMKILGYICVGTVLGSSATADQKPSNLRVTKYTGTNAAKSLKHGNKLEDFGTQIPEIFQEWELSVKLSFKANPHNEWSNVFAIQADHPEADDNIWHGKLGDRIPAVFLHAGSALRLHICNSINDNWNHCVDTPVGELKPRAWYTLDMKQWRDDDGKYMYSINLVDQKKPDVKILEHDIENTNPQVFQTPKAEFANIVPKTANARFKGFRFKTRRAMTPYEKLEIFVEKFEDIVSKHFPDFKGTGKLKDKCDIPKIWDPRGENRERELNPDPCVALGQIEQKIGMWSDIYNSHCKKNGLKGSSDADLWKEKSMTKIETIIGNAKRKLSKKHCILSNSR